MKLSAGARLGPYQILAPLGAGGMGEVYRAQDTRLNRTVAIKILTAYVDADPRHHLRFEREARVVSNLKHPHVGVLYDIGEQDGVPFLVLEYLEGETLAGRLLRGPLPLDEGLRHAIEIADALDHAHRSGIVHRDLKPSNIMLTRSGVKLLDFGLAKPRARDVISGGPSADEPLSTRTLPDRITTEGAILGTLQYMAPEQLHGEDTDARTDVFAFGAVVYEMLTGRRAFDGKSQASVVSAILERCPEPLSITQPITPPLLDQVIARCLAKDPDERWQSASDLRQALKWIAEGGSTRGMAAPPIRRSRGRQVVAALAVVASLAVASLAAVLWWLPDAPDIGAYRFAPLATESEYQGSPAWSPDGKTVAYVAETAGVIQVFTRTLASTMRVPITQGAFDCRSPFWSHDGNRIFYISRARDREGIYSVSAAGGEPEIVMENATAAAISPDGRTLAFFREEGALGAGYKSFWLSSPPGSEPRRYARLPARRFGDAVVHFSPDGSKIGIWGLILDEKALDADGPRAFWIIPWPDGEPYTVDALSNLPPVWPSFSWLPDNRHIVATIIRPPTPDTHLWLVDTQGNDTRPITIGVAKESFPTVSPDGDAIAFNSEQADFDLAEIFLDGSPMATLVATTRKEMDPAWSPTSEQYAFVTDRAGNQQIWLRSRQGQKGQWDEKPIVTEKDFDATGTYLLSAPTFSPDGKRLAYSRQGAVSRIWISTLAGSNLPLLTTPAFQDASTWSPDSNWIAYTAAVGSNWQLAKVRVGGTEAPVVIKDGITPLTRPQWSPDGRWIACDTPEGLSVVSPDTGERRVLSEENWFAYGWLDNSHVIGIRQQDAARRLTLASIDIGTHEERIIVADLGAVPLTNYPIRGFTRMSPRSFAIGLARVRSDVWLLEGFTPPSLIGRLWRKPIILRP